MNFCSLITEEGMAEVSTKRKADEGMPELNAGGGASTGKKVKNKHFIPVLELYINGNFSHTLAYDKLLDVLRDVAENSTTEPKKCGMPMACLKYIFKFVVKSRMLYAGLHHGANQDQFEDKLEDALGALTKIMTYSARDLHSAQFACMRNMVQSIPDLAKVFSQKKLAKLLIGTQITYHV